MWRRYVLEQPAVPASRAAPETGKAGARPMNTHVDPDLVTAASGTRPPFCDGDGKPWPGLRAVPAPLRIHGPLGDRRAPGTICWSPVTTWRSSSSWKAPTASSWTSVIYCRGWLHAFRDPLSLMRRHIWLSFRTPPLRGWHVQQMRRIAIAEMAEEDVLVFCDSDVFFVRPFELCRASRRRRACLLQKDRRHRGRHAGDPFPMGRECGAGAGPRPAPLPYARLYRDAYRLAPGHRSRHVPPHRKPSSGAIGQPAIAARRHFSECILYGRYRRRSAGRTGTCAHGGNASAGSCGMVRRPATKKSWNSSPA